MSSSQIWFLSESARKWLLAVLLFAQVAPGGLPSARCLWQMDAPWAQGVSDPAPALGGFVRESCPFVPLSVI